MAIYKKHSASRMVVFFVYLFVSIFSVFLGWFFLFYYPLSVKALENQTLLLSIFVFTPIFFLLFLRLALRQTFKNILFYLYKTVLSAKPPKKIPHASNEAYSSFELDCFDVFYRDSLEKMRFYSQQIRVQEQENAILHEILATYVAPDIAEQIMEKKTGPVWITERKRVCVFFSDIRGFTTLLKDLKETEVVTILNSYYTAISRAIWPRGRIDKFLGDTVMCVFGLPEFQDSDVEKAIVSARRLQENFRKMVGTLEHEFKKKLTMGLGIGINYGKAVVGDVGSQKRKEHTVIGDVVNTASRLAGNALADEILISRSVFNFVRSHVHPNAKKEIHLKGKTLPQEVYYI